MEGTPGDDVICTLGEDDTVHGLGGDDNLLGEPGKEALEDGRANEAQELDESRPEARESGEVTLTER